MGGEDYVVDGQKMWTSLIQYADYVRLACRTDPGAVRHHGLSIIIVPTSAEGFSWTPVHTVAGVMTSATYYSSVRVPASGQRVIDAEWVQLNLARVHAKAEFLKLVNWKIASSGGSVGPATASATKVFDTEFAVEAYRLLMEVLGANAPVRSGPPGELTAEYARNRVQFGRPIGSFQAVTQRLADAYIDAEAVRHTMWQAAWLLASGGESDAADLRVGTAVATAKFWAADAGHRVAHTAVHVHGGLGIDMSCPVHRYFVSAKHYEFALGGATAQLRRIGADLAR